MSKNLSELSARSGLKNNLFENLAKQNNKQQIAKDFLIGEASVTGTISFYDFLKEENRNKKVYLCNGSACLCAGTQENVRQKLLKHFREDEIGHMTCLGRCHENAAFHFKAKNYSGNAIQQIASLLHNPKKIKDHYTTHSTGEKILTNKALSLAQFSQAFTKIMAHGASAALSVLKNANLRGRGGAGFPIGFKLESAMNHKASQKYIICNADEGDAGAYSDRYLLEQQPLLVLFGILTSAYIVGANYGILYIRGEYPEAIKIIESSIKELTPFVESLAFDFNFKIIAAQGAYICGEETALINSIEGQRPEVRVRPPYPTDQGLFNQPTVVNNVETLASIYAIMSKGADYFQSLGTQHSNGTKLMSLDSFFTKPGIYEVEMGTPLQEIFEHQAAGFKSPVKAVQIGGPLGGIIPAHKFKELTVDFESFSQQGFLLGHASVVCIPQDFPMINYLHHLFEFAAAESCGKCFPCRLGTKRGEELLEKAINTNQKIDRTLFFDLLNTLQQGSLCAHGGGIPLPIKNVYHYFADELKSYFSDDLNASPTADIS